MLYILITLLLLDYLFGQYLSWLNLRHWKTEVPAGLEEVYDAEKYRKAQRYDQTKSRFGFITSTFSIAVMLGLLGTGAFAWLDAETRNITPHAVWHPLLFFGILAIASDLLNLPFSLYRIFVIEERFGFNRTTAGTFILDKVKGYIMGGILGGSLLYVFVSFYETAGPWWWMYVWGVFAVVMLMITMFYASVILPLFNKLKPLPAGELREAIESYCAGVRFRLRNLFVMDGSKRSSKANAFFSGLGGRKRIVLFDTLVEQHTKEELVAVLAHEIGHYKKKHTRTSFLVSIGQAGLMLWLLSLAVSHPALSAALGSATPSLPLGLLAFGILYAPVSFLLGILLNMLSRKHEFEADRYARDTYAGPPLAQALKKLSANNLSNLMPHPLYVFFYYSHPPLLQRLKALER